MATEREHKIASMQAELAAEANQRRIITEELERVKERLLAKSSSINYGTSPKQWQVFSTYLAGIPPEMTLDETNLLDLIGYCVFLLAEHRNTNTADWITTVAMKSADLRKKKRVQRMPVRERTPFKNKRLPKKRGA